MKYNFAQQFGYENLPEVAKLEEIPLNFRIDVYNALFISAAKNKSYNILKDEWRNLTTDLHTKLYKQTMDTYSYEADKWMIRLKRNVMNGAFYDVFKLIQFIIQGNYKLATLQSALLEAFNNPMAYKIHDSGLIIPYPSNNEGEGILKALKVTYEKYSGSNAHLKEASKLLNENNYRLSITESISAVESVLKVLVGNKSASMGSALNELHKSNPILHQSLKDSLSKLYGYTSDQAGLRHSFYDDAQVKVDLSDALFMLTSCSAFITFLDGKFGHLKAN